MFFFLKEGCDVGEATIDLYIGAMVANRDEASGLLLCCGR